MSTKTKWLLISGAFLAFATVCLVVGYSVAGYDVIGWFAGKYGPYPFIVYTFAGIYLIFVGFVLVQEYVFGKR